MCWPLLLECHFTFNSITNNYWHGGNPGCTGAITLSCHFSGCDFNGILSLCSHLKNLIYQLWCSLDMCFKKKKYATVCLELSLASQYNVHFQPLAEANRSSTSDWRRGYSLVWTAVHGFRETHRVKTVARSQEDILAVSRLTAAPLCHPWL